MGAAMLCSLAFHMVDSVTVGVFTAPQVISTQAKAHNRTTNRVIENFNPAGANPG